MQYALSLLHRFPGALALSAMYPLPLVAKRLFYCFCSIFPDIPYIPFYFGVLLFYKVLRGRARQGHFCSQISQTYVVVFIVPFPPISPYGGSGIGLRDSPPFRELIHPPRISCICFSTYSLYTFQKCAIKFFSLRYDLHTLKCTDCKYTVQ